MLMFLLLLATPQAHGFWERATTTPPPHRTDTHQRLSFFRWQKTEYNYLEFWLGWIDWEDMHNRRKLCVVAGISIDQTPLSTATIMNRRILLTAANFLDPHMNRQKDLRAWALGRMGMYFTPYRYRIWRVWRVLPKSSNPEHKHGPRGEHVPRHDLAVIITWDQMYLYQWKPTTYMYAFRAYLVPANYKIHERILIAGSGFEYLTHIYENYKIFYHITYTYYIVDCSKYLPKWWGKFICIKNFKSFPGIQNGGPLLAGPYRHGLDKTLGYGCFEIRYNEDRIFVFTDVRYYTYLIIKYADIKGGQYYEYAYPQWGNRAHRIWEGWWNEPVIQMWAVYGRDLYPLGK